MRTSETAIDTILLTLGTTYSLANIEHILGIIILVIQIIWIVVKLGIKIHNAIRTNKNPDILDGDFGSAIENLEEIREQLNSENKNDE